ncbi:pyridoxamine 5'-phosphate oxidase family protein [Martelella sp. HB161492]|uniref:pyridoxamine 5'-phosphate oxidase family protein n=1 Tax=Martelella sp. HB161492 TaxID=2720726 RepID=UPI001591F826|nr:pyridoxamine 5'-phosphate oxidase family protein [Martelella sp. HB161492]
MTAAFSNPIDAFLLGHHVMSLAVSADGRPWAASVFYVPDLAARRLLFFTAASTRHGDALIRTGAVAAAIAGQERDIARLCGLQIEGHASMLEGDAAAAAQTAFIAAFPEIAGMTAPLWALSPSMIKLTDNAKGFGHKEVWQKQT